MEWKKIIAFVIGLLIFGYLANSFSKMQSKDPEEIKLDVNKTVEELAIKESINVSKKDYFVNQNTGMLAFLSESVADSVIGTTDPQDYISTLKNNSLTEVYYTLKKNDYSLIKIYWARSPGGIFELKEVHEENFGYSSTYSIKSYDSDTVLLQKSNTVINILFYILFAVIALVGCAIAYTILWLLQEGYEYIFDR